MIPGTDGLTLAEWIKNDPGLVGGMILMLSPPIGRRTAASVPGTRRGVLDKPISQSGLFNALAQPSA